MQDIEDFKCVLCKEAFLPPYALPYLLPCTHSLCTKCLQSAISRQQAQIICPEDLESNSLSDVRTDTSSRRALERLVRQHKNYNQNNQLLCIQSLSKHLEASLEQQQEQRRDFLQLIDQIFRSQMQRLTMLQSKIHQELDTPFKVVNQWKENLKAYLQSLKGISRAAHSSEIHSELAYYIEQGRRIKQQISIFHNFDYQEMANSLIACSNACLSSDFSIKEWGIQVKPEAKGKSQKALKAQKLIEQKNVSNFSTNQSSKKRTVEQQNKENISQKRVSSQPLETKKHNISNYEERPLSSISSCPFKEAGRERSTPHNQAFTHRENDHREEPLQQIPIDCREVNSSDTVNLLVYSVTPESSLNRMHSPIIEYEELLLTEKEERKPWKLGNYNFLQECEVGDSEISQGLEIKKREPFNWEKESNNYVRRMSQLRAQEAFRSTAVSCNSLELINYSLQDVEMALLLEKFDWSRLQVVKFVRANLTDGQLNDLLNFAVHGKLQTLVLSGNCLTERALDALLNYTQVNACLHSVYLSRNCINCLKGQTRSKIGQLREGGMNLYI